MISEAVEIAQVKHTIDAHIRRIFRAKSKSLDPD